MNLGAHCQCLESIITVCFETNFSSHLALETWGMCGGTMDLLVISMLSNLET
jgi:hypothetical protein